MQAHFTELTTSSQLLPPPQGHRDIFGRPDAALWYAAQQSEIDGLRKKNFIRRLIRRDEVPKNAKIISNFWLNVKKSSGYKSRWVLRGDQQVKTIDSLETHAPVVEAATFRTLCAIAARENLDMIHVDVNQAFTNSKHTGPEVYTTQPEGFHVPGKEGYIMVLDIGLYGLTESALLWYETAKTALESIGFVTSSADACLFIRNESGGSRIYIVCHVDDFILCATKDSPKLTEIKNFLDQKFGIKCLGEAKHFTSYEITRDRKAKTITLHQSKYAQELLDFTNMTDCIPLDAPPLSINDLSKEQCPTTPSEKTEMSLIPYSEVVGGLLFLSSKTKLEISHSVNKLAKYNSNPGPAHWKAVKDVLRYVKGTINMGITFDGATELELTAFMDSNFAQDVDTRRSTAAFIFIFGQGAISAKSTLLKAVMTSSCEAEIGAMYIATSEVVWLRRLLSDFGYICKKPTILHGDNQGALKYAKTYERAGKMKHINVKHFFVREKLQDLRFA
jgi:hypothetical protein